MQGGVTEGTPSPPTPTLGDCSRVASEQSLQLPQASGISTYRADWQMADSSCEGGLL